MVVDTIPRLPSGKVLRRVLKEQILGESVLRERHGRAADG
jgi:acyl-CoA synthetase (AMP-forming)/AMP-acid ligase II